ncbi:hypothetical protein [Brevundimonas balnearis]|uniref:Sugar transporter n=1 Tax=Brevundimonas balnearis TaxID=1572858 RepID=A0ABV6R0T9_9CAUL
MTDTMAAAPAARTPWHLWLVGVLAVLWNGFGAYDYIMTNTQGATYMASMGMTEAQIAYFNDMPTWMTAAWALGVWGAFAGSVLLLLRMKWAFHAFAISLLGLLGSWIYSLTNDGFEIMGAAGLGMSAFITLVALALVYYAHRMTKAGVLR